MHTAEYDIELTIKGLYMSFFYQMFSVYSCNYGRDSSIFFSPTNNYIYAWMFFKYQITKDNDNSQRRFKFRLRVEKR